MTRTRRFWAFLCVSLLFWFFANQTQIGWLYVVSAVLGGILLAAWWFNRNAITHITVARNLQVSDETPLHEGHPLTIHLQVSQHGRFPQTHLTIIESCPLVASDSAMQHLSMFIPMLSDELFFNYDITIYRRGLYQFAPVQLQSRAPFGFYQRKKEKTVPTTVLVYPELKTLKRFALLDEQPAAELTHIKAGIGSEVIGVRPYRAGDSPRHIHWRSVARRGQLVSKEFAQEIQPGVSLVLDRYLPLSPLPKTKHQPFEMAVKVMVSMAEYAMRRGYPVYLVADEQDMAVPRGALVWDTLMQYSARVSPQPEPHLTDVLNYQALQQFVAVIITWIDETLLEALYGLQHRGYRLFVIIHDVESFPIVSDHSIGTFVGALQQQGIAHCVIKHGDDWAQVISDYAD